MPETAGRRFKRNGLPDLGKLPRRTHYRTNIYCGNSSVGRAQPCQGWGREFESRFPLIGKAGNLLIAGFLVFGKRRLRRATPRHLSRRIGTGHYHETTAHGRRRFNRTSCIFHIQSNDCRTKASFACDLTELSKNLRLNAPHKIERNETE